MVDDRDRMRKDRPVLQSLSWIGESGDDAALKSAAKVERGTIVSTLRNPDRRLARSLVKATLIAVLLLSSTLGPGATAVADSSPSWRGEYYNNVSLVGAPALVRDDASVNFDWGHGSPGTGVNSDQFSARWTSYTSFSAATYTFSVTTDDGARLWVDEQLIIDQWRDQGATTYSASKYLTAGYHSLRVEYYENTGTAVCKVWWSTEGAPGAWTGEYYNNTSLGGSAALVRTDASINFDWGYGSPAAGVNADNFSARWTRGAYFASSATYTFSATVDDGVRVWVDGTIVIDRWYAQSRTTHYGTIYLGAGTHQVKVEYFEQGGTAVCIVNWSGGAVAAQEIIVDDRDSNFIWGGPSGSWYRRYTGYRNRLYWTWNSRTQLHNWAKWFPYVTTAGNWEVFVYIASRYHGSKRATYSIYHGGTHTNKVVNQNIYYNQWVSLGTYYFSGGAGEYVFLGDNTGETYATRFVGFDAVKFVRQDGVWPTPGPTVPSGCAITPGLGFGRIWNTYSTVRSKLGCPTEIEKSIWAGEELFERGYMFWRQDTTYIYVLYNTGTWQGYDDTWTSAEPEWDGFYVPPAGYYQPKRGFGKVWRGSLDVRNGLGWGTTEERGFYASVQAFGGGLMIWSSTQGILVLYNDGTWARYT
jgi:hypothetical protein